MPQVIKHDGSTEPLMINKATASLNWATDGVPGVSVSDIEMQSNLHFHDGITTSFITDTFIKVCDDMSSLKSIGYDTVARNLKLQRLYKHLFQSTKPPHLASYLQQMVNDGHYHESVLNADLQYLNNQLDHSRDFTFTSAGLDALINGYGLKSGGKPLESPQFMYMAIAITIFHDYHKDPLQHIVDMYHALSTFKVALPTPEMKALRTGSFDIASCIAIRTGDSIDSWNESDSALVAHTTASAGCGMCISDVASLGDKVKDGKITHSGKIPIIKSSDALISKASQMGRRGSCTTYVNFYDPEIETIFSLKSPRMPVEDRINDMSYGIKVNQLVYDRAKSGGKLSLFSTRIVTKLNELFYSSDVAAFTAYYEQCESDGLASGEIDARDFFTRLVAQESTETAAYYILNIDECNANTPYTKPIIQSNICLEDLVPTLPLDSSKPDEPAIGVCVLGNLNQGLISVADLPHYTNLMVRAQTHLMVKQTHPTPQANAFVRHYMDIGIGFSNHAYWLACQGLRYGQPAALEAHDTWMEHFSYGLIRASCNLAQEIGAAPGFSDTNWATTMPIDRYNQVVDTLLPENYNNCTYSCDWSQLQADVAKYGMANCGLSMEMPGETSSLPSNTTSSMDPIRSLMTIKDKAGVNFKQFAPDALRLADRYDYLFDRDINKQYIKHLAITQKWMDKGISANVAYSPKWHNNKVRAKDIVSDLFYMKKLGVKGRYYQHLEVEDNHDATASTCEGGGCSC